MPIRHAGVAFKILRLIIVEAVQPPIKYFVAYIQFRKPLNIDI